MHILLTGGTGFFGRAFLDYVICRLHALPPLSVTVLSRNVEIFLLRYPRFRNHQWLNFIQADILEPASLPRSSCFSHVVHAATEATRSGELDFRRQYFEIVDGTRNILELAHTTNAKRFLLISSGAAYGPQPSDLSSMSEDWPGSPDLTDPANAYGLGKRAAEHMCALFKDSYGINYSIARCFAFIGPALPLNAHYAIGNFIRDALDNRDISVSGNGSPLRSYLEQTDLSHWLFTLLMDGANTEMYNVGSDVSICIKDLAILVRDLIAPSRSVHILGKEAPKDSKPSIYVPNIDKAKKEFGLSVTTSLRDAICLTAKYHRRGELR